MAKGGFTDWLPYFIGLSFMIGGTIVVALAAVEIIVVKLYIAMLLAVAPFFIACLLFPQTKGQFDGWLAQLKGFSIALILLGVAIGLCDALGCWWLLYSKGHPYQNLFSRALALCKHTVCVDIDRHHSYR